MDNSDSDEPEKKRPHLNSVSATMARNSTTAPPDNRIVDAAILQYQNQKLVQQLDLQKNELHDLEAKIKDLTIKQSSYDDVLITVNQLWNQLVDDLVFLGLRAGSGTNALLAFEHAHHSRGSIPSCPAEQMFVCRLLEVDSIDDKDSDGILRCVESALALRRSSTRELMQFVESTIDAQREKTESVARALHGKLSQEEAIIQLYKIDDMMKEEANNLREVINHIHGKHEEYVKRIQAYISSHSTDQSEIKRLSGDLEECMAELEESRRKLVNLKMQKDVASQVQTPAPGVVNGNLSPEKPSERAMDIQEIKDSIEEAKILAASRLIELQDAQKDNLVLSKQLQDLQNELNGEKYIRSSRPFTLLNDQLQHWNTERERYKSLTGSLQADRPFVTRREKELNEKAESDDASVNVIDDTQYRTEELKLQLQKCVNEKNDLEIKLEEALQDSGRKDIKAEFRVMASALSKEMEMMEAQLNRWKVTAHEALSLREEAQSLKDLLSLKTNEQKSLAEKCAEQMAEIKALKALIEKLQKEKLETQIVLDMYGQENHDNRDLMEIKESTQRAHAQAEMYTNALDEHSLELRVRAANEAETACQQRLSAAEAEITDLRTKLDDSERDVLELKEAIRIKDGEAEAYIAEIETIGQAYEDMQAQNQHLLQQMTERDDHNIKLVSDSVKTRQAHTSVLSEKQALGKQLQQINTSLESLKLRISHSEEQMKVCISEGIKCTQEDRHLAIGLETAKWELADADKEMKWLKSALSSSEKENEQIERKMDETQSKLDRERTERMKVEEELKEMNDKIAEMASESGEAAIKKLQDEITSCKQILRCVVCADRPKEVVIVKCYHLFCNPCIQKNLEIRHRKCPACGTAFGQNDVKFVKI